MKGSLVVPAGEKTLEPPVRTATADATSAEAASALPRIVSLFSGAGGLDLGFQQAGFPLSFAVDLSPAAIETHRRNFQDTVAVEADLTELGSDGVLEHLAPILEPGESIGVIGGPPCQGFSRANTRSAANDPRNRLPLLYLQIVEALQTKYRVEFVLFENVLGIRDAKHLTTFNGILDKFNSIGLVATAEVYSALDYGVAQRRYRVIVSGFRDREVSRAFKPKKAETGNLTVRSVIEGLPDPVFFTHGLQRTAIPHHENHWTMRPMSKRFLQPEESGQTGRSFRRLKWDQPSPTVAYGHREIHVHPSGRRRLSIYEAMLLQGFPDEFVLEGNLSAQVEQVSNAVPPPLARSLATAIKEALQELGER
ncbi:MULTISPECIES: DNA cytosine methyltransferase [Actinomycetes]|jgi:DNA (cytosine-5-)-methyltransferase|uniref:DNA cytosine methyltransferase n=1 Tax=Actinomycetes TaxID=1760 RepID=UPI0001F65DA3|nr:MULTISPECIES: DNA cytosine methyltransferase [Actinomycetes]EFW10086.1 DNA (cytosine-5-)-methyltransferase [Actinomyces sp. oral taxon 178 str. F0338]